MKKVIYLTLFSLFLVLFISIGTVQAYENRYEVIWYSTFPNGTTVSAFTPLDSVTPGMFSDAINCTIDMNVFGTLQIATSQTLLTNYFSPLASLLGSSTRTITSNITASAFGSIPADTPNADNVYEAYTSLLWGGTSGFATLETSFECLTSKRYLTWTNNVTEINVSKVDSEGDGVNLYTYRCTADGTAYCLHRAIEALQESNFNPANYTVVGKGNWTKTVNRSIDTDTQHSYFEYFVFNSSNLGIANFSIAVPPFWEIWQSTSVQTAFLLKKYGARLYKLSSPEENVSICGDFAESAFPCSVDLSLDPDEIYVIIIEYEATTIGTHDSMLHKIITDFTFTLDVYVPDYICGPWSSCDQGSRWRRCEDARGIGPDRIENRICYTTPEEVLWLGFDESYTQQIWVGLMSWACGCFIDRKSVEYPVNWTVYNPILNYTNWPGTGTNVTGGLWDYVKITDETSADNDTKSLKMWYIPPKSFMPEASGLADDKSVICGNKTHGGIPYLERAINESIFIEHNVTFPAPYMALFYNVKKCATPEIQYAAPNFFGAEYCGPQGCYTQAGNCTEEPRGRMYVQIVDADTSVPNLDIIFEYIDVILEDSIWEAREYNLPELDVTKNYTLRFFALPESGNNLDPDSYCFYLDNVNFHIRDQDIICESYCDEDIYGLLHRAELRGATCVITKIMLSPVCVDEDIWDEIKEKESFCDPNCVDANYAYYLYDNVTGTWSIIENSDFCRTWCAETEEEEEVTETLDAEGIVNMFSFFLSPLFLSIFISVGLGAFVGAKTQVMPMAILTTMIVLVGFTIAGFFPAWILIVVIIMAGFLFARGTLGTLGGK